MEDDSAHIVEYDAGGECYRLKDCTTSTRRMHRDSVGASNTLTAALGDLFADGTRWIA